MKAKELRSLQPADLQVRINELEKELMKLGAQVATGTTPKSPGRIRQIRKTIATIKMVQHEKENKL